jgi:hypothetical protein
VFKLLSYPSYLTPILECLVRSRLWFILLAIVLNLLIRPTFLGFDTLWNTPLGKCYNGTSVQLRTLVIVRITIWSFLASLLGIHNLASMLKIPTTMFSRWHHCRSAEELFSSLFDRVATFATMGGGLEYILLVRIGFQTAICIHGGAFPSKTLYSHIYRLRGSMQYIPHNLSFLLFIIGYKSSIHNNLSRLRSRIAS